MGAADQNSHPIREVLQGQSVRVASHRQDLKQTYRLSRPRHVPRTRDPFRYSTRRLGGGLRSGGAFCQAFDSQTPTAVPSGGGEFIFRVQPSVLGACTYAILPGPAHRLAHRGLRKQDEIDRRPPVKLILRSTSLETAKNRRCRRSGASVVLAGFPLFGLPPFAAGGRGGRKGLARSLPRLPADGLDEDQKTCQVTVAAHEAGFQAWPASSAQAADGLGQGAQEQLNQGSRLLLCVWTLA